MGCGEPWVCKEKLWPQLCHIPDCRCDTSSVPFRFTSQSPAEYKSAIMALAGELQPSSPHGRIGYKATARVTWRLWYSQCWLAHEMNLHAAEPSWDSCSSWCFLPTDQAGWLFKAVVTSWPYMQPSLQMTFPLLQDQEEHKDDKCLSLALEQHEGHYLPWCNCFLC